MRSALVCVTGSRLLRNQLLRPSRGQRPVASDLLRRYCCSSSSSSSASASPSDSPDLSATSTSSPRDEDLRLKMGMMRRSSSLPDVINQFESFLLQELIRSADPDLSVLEAAATEAANPPAHHPHDDVHVEDHDDVSQEVAVRFRGSNTVPEFVICLDERLLDRGIVGWWSRETRLQEEMHCSRILDYVRTYARATVRHRRRIRKQEPADRAAEGLEE